MDTTNGFLALTRRVASKMISLATAEPPGESTRSTTALTELSRAASSSALRTAVLVAPAESKGEAAPLPIEIGPFT